MQWTFDFGWFLGGLACVVAGILVTRFHQKIADELAGGVANYEKVKLFGIGACVLGFIFMANLHNVLLYAIFHLIMPNQFK